MKNIRRPLFIDLSSSTEIRAERVQSWHLLDRSGTTTTEQQILRELCWKQSVSSFIRHLFKENLKFESCSVKVFFYIHILDEFTRFLKKKKKNTSQNVVFLLQTQTEKKIDFHIHFCQHPTFSNQVTAIHSNIIWLYMIHCNIIMMLSSSCICLLSHLLLMSAAYLLQLLRQHLVFVSQLLQLICLTVGDKHKKVWPILSLCLQSVYFYFNIINTYIKAISAF